VEKKWEKLSGEKFHPSTADGRGKKKTKGRGEKGGIVCKGRIRKKKGCLWDHVRRKQKIKEAHRQEKREGGVVNFSRNYELASIKAGNGGGVCELGR